MSDWARIAKDIKKYYQQFDAFVILHGTDTMCYTASALSFMCEDLGKTVILTGSQVHTHAVNHAERVVARIPPDIDRLFFPAFSQVPLSELRNDGRDNLLGTLVIAGQYVIPEVEHNDVCWWSVRQCIHSYPWKPVIM